MLINVTEGMGVVEELLREPTLVVSYYSSASIALIFSAWEELGGQGREVCVVNFDRIPKELLSVAPNYPLRCSESSENLVYMAQKPSEVPLRFRLVTAIKRVIEDVRWARVDKVDGNLYRLWTGNQVHLFRVVDWRVKDEPLPPLSAAIIEVLEEYGGSLPYKDVVLIVSGKAKASREQVRNGLAFLKSLGVLEIENGNVSLNKYSGLKGSGGLL